MLSPLPRHPNRKALATALFHGEGIELGVAEGRFSELILSNRRVRRLWGVDQWSDHHDSAEYVKVTRRLAAAGQGRSLLLRMTFEEALAHFADEALDFVYIDGCGHTAQEDGGMIGEWWRKVKPGGILAGHGYHPAQIATMNSVDRFVEGHGLVLNQTLPADEPDADPYPGWWVEKTKRGTPDMGEETQGAGNERNAAPATQSSEPRWRTDSPISPGESVILVGNGPSMALREELGAQIDAFDQVVRFDQYAIRGFETKVGTKTTLWSTLGRGSRPHDGDEVPRRAIFIHGDKAEGLAIPASEVFGIPRAYFEDVRARLQARSCRDERGKKPLLPSAGLVILLWLQEMHQVGEIALAGFEHFSNKVSSGGPNRAYKLFLEHDGLAEAEWLAELAEAGRLRYLDRPATHGSNCGIPRGITQHTSSVQAASGRKGPTRKLILRNGQSPGDVVMLTAAVRDLHLHYPGQFITDVRTPCPHLWENNPYVTRIDDDDTEAETILCEYPLIHRSNQEPWHFVHAFGAFLADKLGLPHIHPTAFKGNIHLTEDERGWISQVEEITGVDEPFWIVVSGGKPDFTAKWWSPERMQDVVDHFKDRIRWVQVGEAGHHHPPLNHVVDLRGKTDLRQLVRLVYHSAGVVCPVTLLMHLAAAVPMRPDRQPPKNRPAVVIAGGREPPRTPSDPGPSAGREPKG